MTAYRSPDRSAGAPLTLGSDASLYGSDRLASLLRDMGHEYAFINPGSSFRGLHDSMVNLLGNSAPELVLTTHEMIAVGMAHGYAKAAGRPGLCILHNLVGLMNGSMSIFNAFCDQIPLLILGGSGPADPAQRRFIDWAHSANTQGDLVRPYVKWVDEPPTLDACVDAIVTAQTKALTAPCGPAYVSVDAGIQEERIDEIGPIGRDGSAERPAAPAHPDPDDIDELARRLCEARLPLIFGGRFGIQPETTAPLQRLVELTGAAYQDDRNVACMPTEHPQNLNGEIGVRRQADLLLCFDCIDVTMLTTGYSTERSAILGAGVSDDSAYIVDVSLNQYFGNGWTRFGGPRSPANMTIAADPMVVLDRLIEAVERHLAERPRRAEAIENRRVDLAASHDEIRAKRQLAAQAQWDDSPIALARVTHEVYQAVQGHDWLLTVRNHRSWQEGFWPIAESGQYLGGDGGGGVGYGPAAAVGAALAVKESGRLPVAMIGDGDFLMAPGALWTAAAHRTPLLMVILNNRSWGNDELHQIEVAEQRGRAVENAHVGQRMSDPDIAITQVARGMGAWVHGPIVNPSDLSKTLAEAVGVAAGGGVAVVEVITALQ